MSSFAINAVVRPATRKRRFAWRGGPAARIFASIAVVGAGSLLLGQSAQAATDTWSAQRPPTGAYLTAST